MSLIFLINSIDVVKEDEVFDFLQEIDLMKNIGKHQNVIQMYGCCTTCRPICLVLEYAPGGNLLNYLRSLKKKVMYRRRESEKRRNFPNICTFLFESLCSMFSSV